MQTINKKILIVTGVILLGIIVIGAILWTDREESMRQRGGAGKQSYTAQTPDPTAAPAADEEEILSMVHRKDYLQVKLDQKKQTIKVSWEALTNAQKYRLTRYRVRDDKPDRKEMTKTYKPGKKQYEFTQKFSYGDVFRYEIEVFQEGGMWLLDPKSEGNSREIFCEMYGTTLDQSIDDIRGDKGFSRLVFRTFGSVQADGFEIYRGTTKSNMQRIDVVKKQKLQKTKLDTGKKGFLYEDYMAQPEQVYTYQVRPYAIVGGERKLGERSEVRWLATDNSDGKCMAQINVKNARRIKYYEFKIHSTDERDICFGKKYNSRTSWGGGFDFFVGDMEMGGLGDGVNSIDQMDISYKQRKDDTYQKLADDDEIVIRPGKTMYLRLERKDHQSFENYLYGSDGSSNIVSLGMFAYRGRKAMINIEYQHGKTTAVDVTWERYDYKLDSDVAYTN